MDTTPEQGKQPRDDCRSKLLLAQTTMCIFAHENGIQSSNNANVVQQ
jgi:hypothetical protein